MMAGKCDRCGNFFDLNGQFTFAVEEYKEKICNHERAGNGDHYELCPDCATSFEEWVKAGIPSAGPDDGGTGGKDVDNGDGTEGTT